MNDERHSPAKRTDSELGRLLREADPAADQPGLDPVELAQMRRAITEAAEVGRQGVAGFGHGWLKPALATAAIVAVVALGALLMRSDSPDTSGPVAESTTSPDSGPTTSGATEPLSETVASSLSEPATQAPQPETPVEPQVLEPAPIADAVAQPEATTVADSNPSPTDRQARTVQFTAPRGTRIIWTLDPNYQNPTAGRESGQEK